MNYKRKKIEKTLLTSHYIIDVGDKEMKQVVVNGVRYNIQDREDLVGLVHELLAEGYSLSQIAKFLGITEKKVRNMLNDCW